MKPSYRSVYIQRRSEVMAELFLEQLGAVSRVPSEHDFGYDLLLTVRNRRGGANTFGVQVKGTELEVRSSLAVDQEMKKSLALSNIPGFLLVADVKRSKLFYGWPGPEGIPLHEVDDKTTDELRKRLVGWPEAISSRD